MEVAQKKKKKALDGNSGQVIEILVAQKQGREISRSIIESDYLLFWRKCYHCETYMPTLFSKS
jgi:hypothetical protein